MTMVNEQGVMMDKWFKTPNAVVDDITGDVISPQAAAILNSIIRFTEGMQGREWAQIPHAFFMRKTQAKRRETIGKYIKELTDNKLIKVQKINGKTTSYSINWQCDIWYQVASVSPKTSTDEPYRLKRTSTDEVKEPVRMNRTAFAETSTDEAYTYKDIKDINKEYIYKSESEKNDDVISVMNKNAQSILDWQAPDKNEMQAELVRAGSALQMTDDQYQIYIGDFKAHFEQNALKGNPLLGDRNRKNRLRQWLENEAKKQPKSNIFQGNTNAKHQPANHSNQQFDTSTTAGYAAKLDADAAAYYAEQAARTQQSINGSTEGAF